MHHARATLRQRGYRLTPQRTAIWETVRSAGRHVSAEEITDMVRRALPDVNLSTVYRTLELLVGLDLVYETRLGGGRRYFEVAPDPHHHHVCERCGAVGHFGDEDLAGLYDRLAGDEGFVASRSRVTVFGTCRDCGLEGRPSRDPDGPGGRAPARPDTRGEGRMREATDGGERRARP
jgi:Fur family ferric uptake transcriptional regulator